MSTRNLGALDVARRTGKNPFVAAGQPTGFDLGHFWQWSSSDLVGNALRGRLAEFIVAMAVDGTDGVRTEWDAYDVATPDGIRIEVKSAAYLQSWHQVKLSPIKFSIRPTLGWDSATNTTSDQRKRQADLYVFCVLAHKDKATIDPLNLDQWQFYCIETKRLDQTLGDQKTVSLGRLLGLEPIAAAFSELSKAIQKIARKRS